MIDPNDPRHGTTRGYRAGCREVCCRAANTRYDKGRRLDLLRGQTRTVDAIGTKRRVEALHCMGWTLAHIAQHAGYQSLQAINRAVRRQRVTTATAARIAAVYEELSMVHGPSNVTKRRAERNGWFAPLAWDDIDDPNEHPTIGRDHSLYRAEELIAEWDHLRRSGESIEQAARQLGVSVGAIEKAIERAGRDAA